MFLVDRIVIVCYLLSIQKRDYPKATSYIKKKPPNTTNIGMTRTIVLSYGLIVAYLSDMFNVADFKNAGDKLRDKAKPIALLSR